MKAFNRILVMIAALVLCISVTGCWDGGSINFSTEGAVRGASVERIARGLADKNVQRNEDSAITDRRRASFVEGMRKLDADLDKSLEDVIKGNHNFKNLRFTVDRPTIPIAGLSGGGWVVMAAFDLSDGSQVLMTFVVEEKPLIGPLRATKNPYLIDLNIYKPPSAGSPLVEIRLPLAIEPTFALVVNKNKEALTEVLAKVAANEREDIEKKRALAALDAEKQKKIADCIKSIDEDGRNFEVDPSLGMPERELKYQTFELEQSRRKLGCSATVSTR